MDKRPFSDAFAEKVLDAQVKEIDRLHAINKDILRVNLEHANNTVQMRARITELEAELDRDRRQLTVATEKRRAAVLAEREACARIADEIHPGRAGYAAQRIRARPAP